MLNIPDSPHPRIVIIGAGFAGFTLAKKLKNKDYQVVLIDKNNFHQFQPLFYQVAMAGLEPSSIIYPIRKAFQSCKNILIRVAEVTNIDAEKKRVYTASGDIYYDTLVVATGAVTNFFGNKELEKNTYSLKSISEALGIRNAILGDLEQSIMTQDYGERQGLIDIAIVGGGPTGVELAGALAEMKQYILPKDYKELDSKEVDIYLIQGGDRLLPGMSEKAGDKAKQFLEKMGVHVMLGKRVEGFDGEYVHIKGGENIQSNKVIWAAGVKGNIPEGFGEDQIGRSSRLITDQLHQVVDYKDVYAIGDAALMITDDKPYGDPQVAQVALQQAKNLAKNLLRTQQNKFEYKDLGSMATIGRNRAVADLGSLKMGGFFAWVIWLFVHVMSLVGFKNRIVVMLSWLWNYITYDQSLRVIIKHDESKLEKE